MSDVFLSYKHGDDAARAGMVRQKLEALGITLFIDVQIGQRGDSESYIAVINKQLASAAAVLVLWTEHSIQSDFVISEAERGFNRRVLVTASFGQTAQQNLPVPFNTIQAPDLSGWIEAGAPAAYQQWQNLLGMLGRRLQRPGLGELAIALEMGSDEAKRAFVQAHPKDPLASRLTQELENVERERAFFDKRMQEARKKVKAWFRKTEARLQESRDEFDRQLIDLRAGRHFEPPDPVTALDQNVAKLRDDVEAQQVALKDWQERTDQAEKLANELRARMEQAGIAAGESRRRLEDLEKSAAETSKDVARKSEEIASLKAQIKKLSPRRGEMEKASARADKLQSDVEALQDQLADKEANLSHRAEEIAALREQLSKNTIEFENRERELANLNETAASARAELETKILEVAGLQEAAAKAKAEADERLVALTELQSRPPAVRGNSFRWGLVTALVLVAGLAAGALLHGVLGDDSAAIGRLTSENQSLTTRLARLASEDKSLTARLDRITGENETLTARVGQLTTERDDLSAQLKKVPGDKQSLLVQIKQLTDEKNALDKQIKQLMDDNAARDSQIKQLTDQAEQLKKSNAQLADQAELLRKSNSQLTEQAEQLKRSSAQVTSQVDQLKKANTQLLEQADLLKKANDQLMDQLSQLRKASAQSAADNAALNTAQQIAKCDELSAFQFDTDKPVTSLWWGGEGKTHRDILVDDARKACEAALKFAVSESTRRRVTLQLGRVQAALAGQYEASQQAGAARSAIVKARDLWIEAAELGSGQASYLLGRYYHGEEFGVSSLPDRDLRVAWTKYVESALRGSPYGLTLVAAYLQAPGVFSQFTVRDPVLARKYLELASRSEYPRTYFIIGTAMLEEDKGYKKDADAAAVLIALAYCKRDEQAVRYYARRAKPGCDP